MSCVSGREFKLPFHQGRILGLGSSGKSGLRIILMKNINREAWPKAGLVILKGNIKLGLVEED